MSEATEEPMSCEDCGGTMTDEDAFSMSLGEYSPVYWHEEHSGCIASLGERLAVATKRAEKAEAERVAQKVLDWLREEGPILNSEIRKRLKARNIADPYATFVLRRLRNMDLIRNVRKPTQRWFAVPMIDTDPTGPIDDVPQPETIVKVRKKTGPPVAPPPPWIHPIRRRALGLPAVGKQQNHPGRELDPGSPLAVAKSST